MYTRIICTAIVLSGCLSVLPAQNARIAAWNLGGLYAISESKLKKQAEGIAKFKPDLLLLSEVNPISAITDLARFLTDDYNLNYSSLIIDQVQTELDIGVLVGERVRVNGEVGLVKGSHLNGSKRDAIFIDARIGAFDFRLIGVHLKSNRNSTNRRTRVRQCQVIARFIEDFKRASDESDVLLVGDYNMIPGSDDSAFKALARAGLRFVSTEKLCSDQGCTGTHINSSGVGNLLDGYAITGNDTQEYQDDLERVNLPQMMNLTVKQFRDQVTDHFPLMATFNTDQDDD